MVAADVVIALIVVDVVPVVVYPAPGVVAFVMHLLSIQLK